MTFGNIRSIETYTDEFVCFVKVKTDQGLEGWGQTSTYNADITAQVLHRQVVPWVLGQSADDIGFLIDRVEAKEHKFPGSYRCRANAGLDTALWDLQGKALGKPVVELLGGTPKELRAYASSMKRDITPQDEAKRFVKLRDEFGFDAFKWRVGAECGNDVDEWPGRTEEVAPVVSKALGDGISKLVDGNSGFSPKRAIEVGKMLQSVGITHFEEPCKYWELEETKEVTDALDIDVTGGEQDWDLSTWRRMIDVRAVDVLQPDVMYMGGIYRTLKVVEMAKQAGMPITPHSANLSLVTICTMHLLGAISNPGKYLEFSIEQEDYYPWQVGLFLGNPFKVSNGRGIVTGTTGVSGDFKVSKFSGDSSRSMDTGTRDHVS